MKTLTFFLVCISIIMMSAGLHAQVITLTFQPGPDDGMDALFRDDNPATNFGDDENFTSNAWTVGGNPCILRSLIRFDLSAIPVHAEVLEARLSFYCLDYSGIYQLQAGENASQLLPVTENWDEHTVNWINQPGVSAMNAVLLPTSTNMYQDYPDLDVTQSVRVMVENPAANHGWMLRLVTEQIYRSMVFASSDCAVEEWRPKLVVTYKMCDPPLARFGYLHEGPKVSFSDSSSSASSWFWDFGDGYFSNLQHPVHEYVIPGKYRVCLTVSDSCGTAEICDTVQACDLPETLFSHSVTGRTAGFADQSAGASTWYWNFGDGFYSDLSDPVHVFNEAGTYQVCLTCGNGCGFRIFCDSVTVTWGTGTNHEQPSEPTLYPNPAHGTVRVILPEVKPPEGCQYEIAEITGRMRASGTLSWNGGPIDLTGLQPGVYLFRLWSEGRVVTRKLVVY